MSAPGIAQHNTLKGLSVLKGRMAWCTMQHYVHANWPQASMCFIGLS